MERTIAEQAVPLLKQIQDIEVILSKLNTVINEGWQLTRVDVTAPSEGASLPAGTVISLIPIGSVGQVLSIQGLQLARDGYSQELADLYTQLESL